MSPAIVLPIFRAMALPLVAATYPARSGELRASASAAVTDASDAGRATTTAAFAAGAAFNAVETVFAYAAAKADRATAYAAANAARAAALARERFIPGPLRETDIWKAIDHDIAKIGGGMPVEALAEFPLWSGHPPEWSRNLWPELKTSLLSLDEDWDVWTRWYDARLAGDASPGGEELDIYRVTLPEDLWKQGPRAVNAAIKAKEEEIEGRQKPPIVPDEVAGLAWDIDPASGLIAPVFRHSELADAEIDDMERQRPYLLACARDLLSSLNSSLSNSVKQAVPIAESYSQSIDQHSSKVSIDEVYSLGVRLRMSMTGFEGKSRPRVCRTWSLASVRPWTVSLVSMARSFFQRRVARNSTNARGITTEPRRKILNTRQRRWSWRHR